MLFNSFVMALAIALGKIAISLLSAFAIVYFRFPFRKTAFWVIFVTLMLPVEVRIYPTYAIAADLNLLDTYTGLDRAADRLGDGDAAVPAVLHDDSRRARRGRADRRRRADAVLRDMLLPLSRTNIAALFVILFIYGWNQYLWPLLITTRDDMQTIVIGIKKMIATHDALTEWQLAMATAVLAMLPPVARGDLDAEAVRQRSGRDGEMKARLHLRAT